MTSIVLCTFQQISRVRDLRDNGVLVSDWEGLPPFERATYPVMVAAMEQAGIHTEGRPPVWAWGGVPIDIHAWTVSGRPRKQRRTGETPEGSARTRPAFLLHGRSKRTGRQR